ncbi:MAG TPA: glycosyltransferase [Syntrophorhabdaceae bacterium]|jgi:ceramide glucosyltransferase
MTVLDLFFLIVLLLGCSYTLFSIACVQEFFRDQDLPSPKGSLPSISVLKAIKGLDSSCSENLSSFCAQDYPSYEVLFGFKERDDPAVACAEAIAASASCNARVVIDGGGTGVNQKVANLETLACRSRYQMLALSDSDMYVDHGYLRRIVGEYQGSDKTGIVTSLYKISCPLSVGSALESLSIALDFIPSVLVARRLEGVTFGLGASILISKEALREIGGFGDIAGYLADDYQLGYRLWKKGYTNILSRGVIENRVGPMSVVNHLSHQLRWARTYRASRPLGFFGYGITHVFFFSLLFLLVKPGTAPAIVLLFVLTLRYILACLLYRKVIRRKRWLLCLFLLPFKEISAFLVWLWSFAGSRVRWRGTDYRISRDGRLTKL